ncbi:MAG TPA: methyltransferase domain-containing protein [Chryseosolibacter sp.]|nr:methyltransferase domain-containing protein [Chryseosolibacter sp.]
MPDLSIRSNESEVMDDLQSSGEIIGVTLRELETINLLLGGNYVTIDGVRKLLKKRSRAQEIVIGDVGCGSGDILKLIRKWLNRNGWKARLMGFDANENIAQYATAHTDPNDGITYHAVDIFSEEFKNLRFDIVTGTLFFHHFKDDQLAKFFRQLKSQVRIGIIINDIHRHWFAYYSIKWLTRAFSKSSMVINDAPLSVARAFKKNDLINILSQAGIANYTIRWMWAFRWQVVIHI